MKTRRQTHPFAGARRMKPTLKHLPAIWECMLGTVYARSPEGKVEYFDYDWDAARRFARVDDEGADLRLYRAKGRMQLGGPNPPAGSGIRNGQMVLWRKDA